MMSDKVTGTPTDHSSQREQHMFNTHIGMARDLHTARIRSYLAVDRWRPIRNRRKLR